MLKHNHALLPCLALSRRVRWLPRPADAGSPLPCPDPTYPRLCPLVTQHMYNLMGGARVGDTDFSNLFWPKHKVSMGEMATWFGHFANLVSGVGAGGLIVWLVWSRWVRRRGGGGVGGVTGWGV